MSASLHRISLSVPSVRSTAVAALLGATMLVSPLTAARADGVSASMRLAQATPQAQPVVVGAETKPETVEARITSLHTDLAITASEEKNWTGVAQAMRDNAAAMQKLAAEKAAQPETVSAVEDLKTYEKFAQAHVAGLKNLTSEFETLYNAMPDAQKKVADGVFQNFGRAATRAHG